MKERIICLEKISLQRRGHTNTMLSKYTLADVSHELIFIDYLQEGRNTVWPHNPRTGWSYCVTIPSWIAQTPEAGVASDNFLKSIVVSITCLFPSCFLHLSQGV